ncbi:hypothetical protein OG408_06095 [Streptomyces sp. NBC_01257]|nr:hypothetical protein OG408_06095 [Streptomyces sp. NBC_01257]
MPTSPSPGTAVRSPAAVNADIRALGRRSSGRLLPAGRREYERLLAECAAAVRGDDGEAA